MKTVLIIGPAPSRIGGVSTHITRLTWLLKDDYEFDFIDEARGKVDGYYNCRSIHFLTYLKKLKNADIVHIHSALFVLRVFHIVMAKVFFHKRVCVSIHHDLNVEGHMGITKKLLSHCDCAILDSQDIFDTVYIEKVRCVYRMMPAFLPPIIESEEDLPPQVLTWIDKVRKNKKNLLMCSSSYSINDYNGVDLYGNDMSLDAVKILNEQQQDKSFYLIMIIHNSDRNPDRLMQYQKRINNELKDKVLLLTSPLSFLRVMMLSDVVLRPTNTDGDSLTVREALFLSKSVVASNCATRPEGTIVFKTRDVHDYCDKILIASNDKEKKNGTASIDFKAFYLDCYENNSSSRK